MTDMAEEIMTDEQKEMIEEFQCPGCTLGMNVTCGRFDFTESATGCWCIGHSAGTMMTVPGMGIMKFALGLPIGFNRVGTIQTGFEDEKDRNQRRSTNIRLVVDPFKKESYDDFNVPVWAMEHEGYLFVRVMSPRINFNYVDVIKGGKFEEICPNAIDVAKFANELD